MLGKVFEIRLKHEAEDWKEKNKQESVVGAV